MTSNDVRAANAWSRRSFLRTAAAAVAGAGISNSRSFLAHAQPVGDRPPRLDGIEVLNPRGRIPISFIIDDATCLVNLNKFAIPQFAAVHPNGGNYARYDWRSWPDEIPDDFVRKFGEWCGEHGVKGKYSIVPYPACVGRLDRELPGWTPRQVEASIELVRTLMMPNWDIHPEMVTHTRVIDTRTGQPYPERSLRFMENWDWTTGRSVDELTGYQTYALRILKNVGLTCEGITTPGGYGNRARPQLAQATLESVRDVFGAEIPHYFRDLYDEGDRSVAPLVQYASGLDTEDPRCVVSIIGCTADWTGGWDNTTPAGADKFITPDGQEGRLVEVIARGDPACLVAHWTGLWWNGQELGFKIFQEVLRRLRARFDHLAWMKLSEIARYWAAKELTRIDLDHDDVVFHAPFAAPSFTFRIPWRDNVSAYVCDTDPSMPLREVATITALKTGTWLKEPDGVVLCLDLPKGRSRIKAHR